MRIELKKQYQTRGGRKAVITGLDSSHPEFYFMGFVEDGKHREAHAWRLDGSWSVGRGIEDTNDIVGPWVEEGVDASAQKAHRDTVDEQVKESKRDILRRIRAAQNDYEARHPMGGAPTLDTMAGDTPEDDIDFRAENPILTHGPSGETVAVRPSGFFPTPDAILGVPENITVETIVQELKDLRDCYAHELSKQNVLPNESSRLRAADKLIEALGG